MREHREQIVCVSHFRTEALALSKLNHPNIATIHDFDTQQEIDFLVMEYLSAVTLSERIANHALPEKECTRLGLQGSITTTWVLE